MENNTPSASETLLAQERESHKQIFDYIAMQDLEAASNELRIDLVEFMGAAQALMSPGCEDI
jgi:DNA-binding GntR family transcriptional regulator